MLFDKVHDICIQACVMEETESQNQSLQSSINKCFVFTQLIRRQEFMGWLTKPEVPIDSKWKTEVRLEVIVSLTICFTYKILHAHDN